MTDYGPKSCVFLLFYWLLGRFINVIPFSGINQTFREMFYQDRQMIKKKSLYFQVWFQNRRAKWRRQEKLEVSSIKLQDTPSSSLLSFSRSPTSSLGSGLQLEPWLSTPITTSTSLQSLSGFVSNSQGLPGPYTPSPPPPLPSSLPSSFLNSPALGHSSHLPHISSMCLPPPAYQCSADPRNSSIASLRMKAKEHIQSIGKTWWCWVDFKTPEHIMMNLFGEIWLHFHDGIVFFFLKTDNSSCPLEFKTSTRTTLWKNCDTLCEIPVNMKPSLLLCLHSKLFHCISQPSPHLIQCYCQ